jgi:hypothetical protein
VFSLLLFGIFEYCRYLFVLHITNLAAREGVRYASVNVATKPPTFDTTDYTDASGKKYRSILNYTKDRLGGAEKQVAGYVCNVYPVDLVGLGQTPVVVRPKSKNPPTYPDPTLSTYLTDGNKVDWNTATYPDRLAVQITGTFTPFLPNLTLMPTLPVRVIAITGAEG